MGRLIMIMFVVAAVLAGAPSTAVAGLPGGKGVGDTIRLNGLTAGEAMAVTLTRVVDPARGSDDANQPSPGDRLVATQFRVTNVGSVAIDDAPLADVTLIDRAGQAYDPSFNTVSAGPTLPSDMRIVPGASRLGYVTFEVPSSTRVAQVQYVPDAGFAADTGVWDLPVTRPKPPPPPAPLS